MLSKGPHERPPRVLSCASAVRVSYSVPEAEITRATVTSPRMAGVPYATLTAKK